MSSLMMSVKQDLLQIFLSLTIFLVMLLLVPTLANLLTAWSVTSHTFLWTSVFKSSQKLQVQEMESLESSTNRTLFKFLILDPIVFFFMSTPVACVTASTLRVCNLSM